MNTDSLMRCVQNARDCYRKGFYITADTYMRHALGEANRLKDAGLRSRCFRIRNKLRPLVHAALDI